MTAPTQPKLPDLRIPDHLRVVGPLALPERDRREHAERVKNARRDDLLKKVRGER